MGKVLACITLPMKFRVSEVQLVSTTESQELNELEQLDVQSAVMLSMNQSRYLERLSACVYTNRNSMKAYNPYRHPRLLWTYCPHRSRSSNF